MFLVMPLTLDWSRELMEAALLMPLVLESMEAVVLESIGILVLNSIIADGPMPVVESSRKKQES